MNNVRPLRVPDQFKGDHQIKRDGFNALIHECIRVHGSTHPESLLFNRLADMLSQLQDRIYQRAVKLANTSKSVSRVSSFFLSGTPAVYVSPTQFAGMTSDDITVWLLVFRNNVIAMITKAFNNIFPLTHPRFSESDLCRIEAERMFNAIMARAYMYGDLCLVPDPFGANPTPVIRNTATFSASVDV